MSATPIRGPLCTTTSLVEDFRRLHLRPGDVLLVHSSLRSLGWVCGGAEAVVAALLEALGDSGTLVVPTHTGDNSDPAEWRHPRAPEGWHAVIRASMPAYDPRTSRTRAMGRVPETVRTWPGALRSAHPQTSFAAIGPDAGTVLAGHALDCRLGENSPLARLEKVGAKVLLLGVSWESCTAFHLAEYRLSPGPALVKNAFAVTVDNERRWMEVTEPDVSDAGFASLGADYERQGSVITGQVGAACARLFPLADAVSFATRWLTLNRL